MINGIRIQKPPEMNKYSELDILSDLDVLEEMDGAIKTDDGSIGKYDFESSKFHVKIMRMDDPTTLHTLLEVTTVLEEAAPELVKTWMWNEDKVILAYPTYYYKSDGVKGVNLINVIIDELLRVAGWCLKNFQHEEAVEFVREYIELYIKW